MDDENVRLQNQMEKKFEELSMKLHSEAETKEKERERNHQEVL